MEIKSPMGVQTPKVQEPSVSIYPTPFAIHHSSDETITIHSIANLYLCTTSIILLWRKPTSVHMRVASALLYSANKFKPIHPVAKSWVASLTPNKQMNNGIGEELMKEKVEPVVVFSKPPPTPPVIGPLVLFSLFEAWSSRDSDD